MKDSINLLEKLNQIQEKINVLKTNSEKFKNGIPFEIQSLVPKPVESIISTSTSAIKKQVELHEPIIKRKLNDSILPTPIPIIKPAPVVEKPIVKKQPETTISVFKNEPISPFASNAISTPSYIDIEADGYTITSDFIQLYNGNFLKCPSLTVAGSFSSNDKKNVWNFLDAECNIRGTLKKMSNFIELVLEPGKWTHFKCQGKIRVLGSVDRETLYFNKQIVVAKGLNEDKKPSELIVKSYNPITMYDVNEGAVFILSFICTQSQILQIN
jgi:hypothetical protein